MRRPRSVEDLTVDELRRLLVEKRRKMRREQLDRFRRTGRVVTLASDEPLALEDYRVGEASETDPLSAFGRKRTFIQRMLDGLLVVVEILAVLGLVFVTFNMLGILDELNQEFSAGLVQPTLTPTPLIMAVVLPSGHTPPDQRGQTVFNYNEIPDHLLPIYQSLVDAPVPTPGPEHAIRIQIPAINVDAPVVQGDGPEQLKKGVGAYVGSVRPGQNGNVVLSAHNDIYGEFFRNLDQLKRGDKIVLYTSQRAFTYIVVESPRIIEPTQVEVMAQTEDPVVTLISCYPYLVDNKRIVIRARLQDANE